MQDPVIACFWEEFERFHDFAIKQIDACPDELWLQKCGGFPLWQQFFHLFAYIEILALPRLESPLKENPYPPEGILLTQEVLPAMTKKEMHALAERAHGVARGFMSGLTTARLTERHERLSERHGKERTLQFAVITLIRHTNYHLGCCEAILRDRGLAGIY